VLQCARLQSALRKVSYPQLGRARAPLSMLFSARAGGIEKTGVGAGFRRCLLTPHTFSFMKPLCDLCGSRHESYQAHVFATNRIATNTSATNRDCAPRNDRGDTEVGGGADGGVRAGLRDDPGRSKNRRSKEAYNAYQREYMRRRRALAKNI
jgi:hypothetical protein